MAEDKPITPQQQPKFAGIKTYMRLPHSQTMQGIDFAVAGIPWDGATSYRTGQRLGPDAIRKISVTLRPYNFTEDIGIFEHCSGVDYGDLSVVPGYIEDTYDIFWIPACAGMTIKKLISDRYHRRHARGGGYPVL